MLRSITLTNWYWSFPKTTNITVLPMKGKKVSLSLTVCWISLCLKYHCHIILFFHHYLRVCCLLSAVLTLLISESNSHCGFTGQCKWSSEAEKWTVARSALLLFVRKREGCGYKRDVFLFLDSFARRRKNMSEQSDGCRRVEDSRFQDTSGVIFFIWV